MSSMIINYIKQELQSTLYFLIVCLIVVALSIAIHDYFVFCRIIPVEKRKGRLSPLILFKILSKSTWLNACDIIKLQGRVLVTALRRLTTGDFKDLSALIFVLSVTFRALTISPLFAFSSLICLLLNFRDSLYRKVSQLFQQSLIPKIENFLMLIMILKTSKSIKANVGALLLYLKATWQCDSLFMSLYNSLEDRNIYHFIDLVFTKKSCKSDGIEPQAGVDDVTFTMQGLIDNWEDARRSPIYDRLRKLYLILLSSQIFSVLKLDFSQRGYTAMEEALCKKEIDYGSDGFYLHFLKSTHFIITKGVQIYRENSFDALRYSDDQETKWFREHRWLMSCYPYLNCPNLCPHEIGGETFSRALFESRLKEAMDLGSLLLKRLLVTDPRRARYIDQLLAELMKVRTDVILKNCTDSKRKTPYAILLESPPSVGKSIFTNVLFAVFGKYKCKHKEILPTQDKYKYVRNFTSQFWDSFNSSMWCLVLDDIAFQSVGISRGGGDPSVMEIIQIINTVPYVPNQAALEDKGRTPLLCELVVGTTNTADLNAGRYFSCPSAALRRFRYVVSLSVKSHLCEQDSGQLDSDKITSSDYVDDYPNFWNIVVHKVMTDKTTPSQVSRDTILFDSDSIIDFIAWYCSSIDVHYAMNEAVGISTGNILESKFCSTCKRPCCTCSEDNSSVMSDESEKTIISHEMQSGEFKRTIQSYRFIKMVDETLGTTYEYMAKARERAQNAKGFYMILILPLFASVIAIIIKCWQSYNDINVSLQGSVLPKPSGDEKENVWYADRMPLTTYDLPTSSRCERSEDITRNIARNTVNISIKKLNGNRAIARAICLKSNIFVTTSHSFDGAQRPYHIRVTSCEYSNISPDTEYIVNEEETCTDRDLKVFRLNGCVPFKNIMKYIPKQGFTWRGSGRVIVRDRATGKTLSSPLHNMKWETTVVTSDITIVGPTYESHSRFVAGSCGSPILVDTNNGSGNILIGLHCAGPKGWTDNEMGIGACKGYSHALIREDLEDFISTLHEFGALSHNVRPIGLPDKPIELQSLHFKSPLRYIEKGVGQIYGSLNAHRGSHKSTVCPHLCAPYFHNLGLRVEMYAPNLKSYKPWRIALLDSCAPLRKFDTNLLEHCAENYLHDIFKRVPLGRIQEMLHPLDMAHTINGAKGIAFLDSIPRSTSAGFPWCKTKKTLFTLGEPTDEHDHPIIFCDEVMDRVDQIKLCYEQGVRASPIFMATLKDEPVSRSKHESGKVRVFSASPIDFTLVMRQYLLTFARLVQRHRSAFEACPGLICQSREWHDLRTDLTQFGEDRLIEGDFRAFDKTAPAELMMMSFKIIYEICVASGNYSELEKQYIKGIATDVSFALTNFNGDLLNFVGSNPSGQNLTVIVNGIINSLYMRYAYANLNPKKTARTFRRNVALYTYGDDNIMGSRVDWFNHTAISEYFATIGITYTMADKNAKSVPFIHMDKCTFLKRKWRFDNDTGHYMAALDENSIKKMITIWTRSKCISQEEQAFATLVSANREYFFHGKKCYEQMKRHLLGAVDEYGLRQFITDTSFPTWDYLVDEYHKAHRNALPIQEL